MAITRVTQGMLSTRALTSIQGTLSALSRTQEQLSTGRILNRPSDNPTDTTSAMRIRSARADQQQYVRNGNDGIGWLDTIDSTLQTVITKLQRARDLALQGANAATSSPASRQALATEIDQLRQGLISDANTKYLDRPVFGGLTSGGLAFDASGQYVGVPGAVNRTVADGVQIAVNVDGTTAFGPVGNNVFDQLASLSTDLRTGNQAGIEAGIINLKAGQDQVMSALSDVGTRQSRIQDSISKAQGADLTLASQQSQLENVDMAKASVDFQMEQIAYQAALQTTAKVMQPSLLDFLR